MKDKKITSVRQLDQMVNVNKPGPVIVLTVLLVVVSLAVVFVFAGRLERKITVNAHCDGEIDPERIQMYFSEKLNNDDDSAYQVLFSYLDQLDPSGHYTLFDTTMAEEQYRKVNIRTGARVRFENGLEGIVAGGLMASKYEDLFGEFFSYTEEDLFQMNVYPGQEPYYMVYIFTGRTDQELEGSCLPCEIVTESIALSGILH